MVPIRRGVEHYVIDPQLYGIFIIGSSRALAEWPRKSGWEFPGMPIGAALGPGGT